jgi:class 3 adenylate cyclase/pimeloyl-ACP methyl ester carboxylesterase
MELRMQYATASDGVRVAFAVAGSGPTIVRTPALPFGHVQLDWRTSEFYERLTKLATVVVYDSRGTGLSDRDVQDLSLEARVRDLEAVVDRLQLDRFAVYGVNFSAATAITYVVGHRDRVSHLILEDAFARTAAMFETTQNRASRTLAEDWDSFIENLAWLITQKDREETRRYADFLRACVTQDMALRLYEAMASDDVTDLLPLVTVPTLVLHHEHMRTVPLSFGRELAASIPGAEMVTLAGSATDDADTILDSIGALLGSKGDAGSSQRAGSAMRAVLFTDIVGHTEMMQRLGDTRGRDVLREHERITRETLKRHGGTEVKTMGDGFMASFGSVTQSMECAIELQRAFARHTIASDEPLLVRVGLNAGEPIEEEGDLFGSTVILASRIAAKAEGGEILASVAVRELSAGKNFLFADRGETALRGFEDPVRLYEVRWQE